MNNLSVTGNTSHNTVITHFRMMACNCKFVLIPAVVNLKGNEMSHLMHAHSHEICPHGLITQKKSAVGLASP